ncbi:MAG TPA: autotransporter-associated beta strand repeat-containing protein, partial [Vicinamibacterales bacterium]
MKRRWHAVAILTALLLLGRSASAQQTLIWLPNGVTPGGSGTWNTSVAVWSDGAACCSKWTNVVSGHDSVFDGTPGTVTLSTGIRVRNITFNSSGYLIAGNTLTLTGSNPSITTASGTSAISSRIAGSAGLIKAGTGLLSLTGANTYTGTTTISAGTLQIGNGGTAGQLGTGAVVNDAALIFNRSNNHTVANLISGTGTLTKLGA